MERLKTATKAAMLNTAEFVLFLSPALVLLTVSWQVISRYQDSIVRFIVTF